MDGSISRRLKQKNTGYYQGGFHVHSQAHPFDVVMQMGYSEEQGREENGHERRERLKQQWHHAGTERELLGERRDNVVSDPQNVLKALQPVRRLHQSLHRSVQRKGAERTQEENHRKAQGYEHCLHDALDPESHNLVQWRIVVSIRAQQEVNEKRRYEHNHEDAQESLLNGRRVVSISKGKIISFGRLPNKEKCVNKTRIAALRGEKSLQNLFSAANRSNTLLLADEHTDSPPISICTNCRRKLMITQNMIKWSSKRIILE